MLSTLSMGQVTLRTHLLGELAHRKNRNSSYSIRAFARDLGVGVTTLSDYLTQKRSFSKTNLQKIIDNLGLSPLLKDQFFIENKPEYRKQNIERVLLEDDTFKLISDWYYLAILNLASLKNNSAEPIWIAERLGLEPSLVEEALLRLYRLNLLEKVGTKLKRTTLPLASTTDIPSSAIRKFHKQILNLAEEKLHNEPIHKRDFGAVVMTVNKDKLEKAKAILLKTRHKIADLLSDDQSTEVYTLSMQLFPLTKEEKDNERKNEN